MDSQTISLLLFVLLMAICCGGMMIGGMRERSRHGEHKEKKSVGDKE